MLNRLHFPCQHIICQVVTVTARVSYERLASAGCRLCCIIVLIKETAVVIEHRSFKRPCLNARISNVFIFPLHVKCMYKKDKKRTA